MRAAQNEREALDLPGKLATLYTPVLPYLKKIDIRRAGRRGHNPKDILLPKGYRAEVVATGFDAPVHCCFDGQGNCYVTESGHKTDVPPRILKVDPRTGDCETFLALPEARWKKTGAMTGACWHDGYLYFMNTDTLSRIRPGGPIEDIVTGLRGLGDHQANHPIAGADGKIYFGMGTATNCGVVGADNAAYEWLPKFPGFHDVPAQDITLVGRNYSFANVLGDVQQRVRSGAFAPFGTQTMPGQVIKGDVRCNGAVLRCNPDGSDLEVVAWGLRNPFGIAHHPDGRLFATEHGMDERGARYVVDDADDFYEIQQGAWYGWPDFASGIRLDDFYWGEGGQGREPVMAEHPDPHPPRPFVRFEPHAAANGFDFSRGGSFGFEGDAFVALFGDLAPVTSPKLATPAGFKLVRVDMQTRRVVDFAVNRIEGPASKLPHGGFERPSHCTFGPDGALYIVDYGQIKLAPERGGIRVPTGTGTLWRIVRTEETAGERPPEPITLPLYALQAALMGLAVLGSIAVGGVLLVRGLKRK